MKITFQVSQDVRSQDNGPIGLGALDNSRNQLFAFNLGDTRFTVESGAVNTAFEVPAKTMRSPNFCASGATVPAPGVGDLGPHEDFMFMRDSVEYTYTTRALAAGGVIEKQMPVGAVPGMEGRMILYKGCTSISDCFVGNWTARLIRPFLITAADLTDRQTGWPLTGAVPTINTTSKSVVDNSGDGYNHI
jgi:hypothetical protein